MSDQTQDHTPAAEAPFAAPPVEILRGIILLTQKIGKIKHDAENKHQGYTYASSEAIYEATRQEMAGINFTLLTLETRCDQVAPGLFRIEYQFVLAVDEHVWTHPANRRTVYIAGKGPQTFQAAQSYAEKSYLKSLFKLVTGEPDTESLEQTSPPAKGAKVKVGLSPSASKTKAGIIIGDLKETAGGKKITTDAATLWTEKWATDLEALQPADKQAVRNAYKAAKAGELE